MKPSVKTVLLNEGSADGLPYALFAQADYTAEHEEELSELYRVIGATPKSYEGIASYSLRQDSVQEAVQHAALFEEAYTWREYPDAGGKAKMRKGKALCLRLCYDGRGDERTLWDHWRRDEKVELSAAYSRSGFEIRAYSDATKAFLGAIHAAVAAGDFACFRGGGSNNPFYRGGLVVAIPSRVPAGLKSAMLDAHADTKRLLEAAEATGIEARLREGNGEPFRDPRYAFVSKYGFWSLSPAWSSKIKDRGPERGGEVSTEHPVIFFLKPISRDCISGWYTVEELDSWLEGKGPVLKNASSQSLTA